MKDINQYITLSKEERQSHLKLNEPCIERGAGSYYFKGLLAHVLDTTIPTGKSIHLCHACHNGACGNPNHLYWGTARENKLDQKQNGEKTIWERTVEKYGLEKAKEMQSKGNKSAGGKANKGKPKSDEHRKKIAEAIKKKHAGVS